MLKPVFIADGERQTIREREAAERERREAEARAAARETYKTGAR